MLDKRVAKKTRNKEYFEYLVKWKGHLAKDSTWMTEWDFQLYRFDYVDTKKNSFATQEFDVGASRLDQDSINSKV